MYLFVYFKFIDFEYVLCFVVEYLLVLVLGLDV